ncbi:hypothetical protein BpHYR1_028240 [Brachionus plicatilis]|uniref:Uncharacterized protein n=1 Tax=Brachionus plicatilis TaxID=10195 RepID=A0A3M7R622_BRAPC|nr:hypothetical protein BpHYR1_028240 [Brachionus plicatilis]
MNPKNVIYMILVSAFFHDLCYGYCYGKKFCDDQFESCLSNACYAMSYLQRQLCYGDKNTMVMAVRSIDFLADLTFILIQINF